MRSDWKLWTDAGSPEKAQRVGRRALERMRCSVEQLHVEPYEKTGGHLVRFNLSVDAENWPEAVIEVLAIAQHLGSGWQLHGRVDKELEAISNNLSVGGLQMALVSMKRT